MQTPHQVTHVIVVTNVLNGRSTEQKIELSERAEKHVLRKFNVTNDPKVDFTKALCAALIQQMIDLRAAAYEIRDAHHDVMTPELEKAHSQIRAALKSIELVEQAQMQLVKSYFVEA